MKKIFFKHAIIGSVAISATIAATSQVTVRTNLRIDEGRYMLQLASGKIMEAESTSFRNDGARVQTGTKYYTLNQLWDIKQAGNGKYYIINVGSGKAVQAGTDGTPATGATVQLKTVNPASENQKWLMQGAGTGKYTFRCAAAVGDKVLSVAGSIIDRNGIAMQVQDNSNAAQQTFSLVKSYDSAVVLQDKVDLRRNQSSLKHQAPVRERGCCTFFGNLAVLEAAYKKRGYGELDLSEEFFTIMAKALYLHPVWSDIKNSNYRENQLGGLQGGGSVDWLTIGLKVPLESNVPFKPAFEGPDYWDTRDQRLADDFNNSLFTNAVLKSPLYYGASSAKQVPAALQRSAAEYERLLNLGYEIDVDLNIAHNYVVVGYDKSALGGPVFFVKDSYETPGTRCLRDCNTIAYTSLLGMISDAHYITEVSEPSAFPELAFLGTWKLDFDGHKGRLDVYHIPGIHNPELFATNGGRSVTDRRIGVFYDEAGHAFRVNGTITGNRINFWFDLSSPNLRWDELKGRSFSYVLNPAQDIMSGFHRDPDGKTYGGYAVKGAYLDHGVSGALFSNFANNNWNLKWGTKSGFVRFVPGANSTTAGGIFNFGSGSIPVTVSQRTPDAAVVIRMGAQSGSIKFLNHDEGMWCGSDLSNNPVLLYRQ